MASVAIIGILAAIVTTNFSKGRAATMLAAEARVLAGSIREMQGYALAGKQLTPGQFPCSFSLEADHSDAYRLQVYSHGDGETTCSRHGLYEYQFPNGVVFSAGSSTSITFLVPFGLAVPTRFVLTRGGEYHTVCVYASGAVSDEPGNDPGICG